jgi:hypothetical protein
VAKAGLEQGGEKRGEDRFTLQQFFTTLFRSG